MIASGDTVSPDEETEEGIRIKGKAIVVGPTQEEFEEHMRTHIPFRNWCEFCVKRKSKNDPHKSGAGEDRALGEEGSLLWA